MSREPRHALRGKWGERVRSPLCGRDWGEVDMAYVLRFVQRYRPEGRDEFMRLEALFAALERSHPQFPRGRRSQPYAGREPGNTLVWDCPFDTIEQLNHALEVLAASAEHGELYRQQVPYMTDAYTEIYEVLDLK